MKQTIEVEVGPEDDAGWCRVESVDSAGAHYVTGVSADTLRDIGLTVPDPAPERTEYRLYTTDDYGTDPVDEVLVTAHSVRVGDRVEWAPGDWREITEVAMDPMGHVVQYVVDGITASLYRWELLAVRR